MPVSPHSETPPSDATAVPVSSPGRRVPFWALATTAAVATVAIAWAAIAATSPQGPVDPVAGPVVATTAPSAPSTPPATEEDAPVAQATDLTPATAEAVISDLLTAVGNATANPDDSPGLQGIAGGMILAELQNQQNELIANGWKQAGTEKVVSAKVTALSPEATPPVATVEACIDSSDVVLLDASNEPIASGMPAAERRATNIYSLTLVDGEWQVTDRSFPDNAAC